MLMHEVKYI